MEEKHETHETWTAPSCKNKGALTLIGKRAKNTGALFEWQEHGGAIRGDELIGGLEHNHVGKVHYHVWVVQGQRGRVET